MFEVAVNAAGKCPDVLMTDGPVGFKTVYKKAMYTRTISRTTHVAYIGIQDRHPVSNVYERFNGGMRDKIARIRGEFKSKNPILLGLPIIYCSFMRLHVGLDCWTPAETAGITISYLDKWRTITGHAALFCT